MENPQNVCALGRAVQIKKIGFLIGSNQLNGRKCLSTSLLPESRVPRRSAWTRRPGKSQRKLIKLVVCHALSDIILVDPNPRPVDWNNSRIGSGRRKNPRARVIGSFRSGGPSGKIDVVVVH